MRSAQIILKENAANFSYWKDELPAIKAIEAAQLEAYNEAIRDAATIAFNYKEGNTTYILSTSILSLLKGKP